MNAKIKAPKLKVAKFAALSERYIEARCYCIVFMGDRGRSEPSHPSKIITVDRTRMGLVTLYNIPQSRREFQFIEVYRTHCTPNESVFRLVARLKMGTKRWVDRSYAVGKTLEELADTAPIPVTMDALSRLALLVTRAVQPYGMSLVRPFEWRPIYRKRVGVTYNLRCDFRIQGQSQLIPALTLYADCGKSKSIRDPERLAKRIIAQTLDLLAQYISIEAKEARR